MIQVKWFNLFEEVITAETSKRYAIVARGFDDFWDILETSDDIQYLIDNQTYYGQLIDEDKELHVFAYYNDDEYLTIHNLVDALNLYNWKICGNDPWQLQSSYRSYLKLKRSNIERELCDNWETYRSFIYPK